ncbi:hypothetical protein J437_LFUL004065 [Ladona fulva]|uniref:Uncharacterized protein n=1 Tax=Ladona fulva TaxID=123851 RepID=A0A8K0NT46_LADFU|nr:hypothetical protein J437_LFUL004065 [Ladona fulva]
MYMQHSIKEINFDKITTIQADQKLTKRYIERQSARATEHIMMNTTTTTYGRQQIRLHLHDEVACTGKGVKLKLEGDSPDELPLLAATRALCKCLRCGKMRAFAILPQVPRFANIAIAITAPSADIVDTKESLSVEDLKCIKSKDLQNHESEHEIYQIYDKTMYMQHSIKEINFDKITTIQADQLFQSGNLENLKSEMKNNKENEMSLSEIRWKGQGDMGSRKVTVFYSGIKKEERVQKNKNIDDRMIVLKIGMIHCGRGEEGKVVRKFGLGKRNERGTELLNFIDKKY